jgi:hypothetical protein
MMPSDSITNVLIKMTQVLLNFDCYPTMFLVFTHRDGRLRARRASLLTQRARCILE